VSRNEISELNPELLKSLPELESVSFDNNYIYEIPEKVFERNSRLKKINLSGNKLKSINPEIFDNLHDLNDVNLNGNECINGAYKEGSLNALKIEIRRGCRPANHHSAEDRDEVDSVDPYNYGPSWGVVESKHNEPYREQSNEIDTGNQLKNVDKNSIECDIIEEYSEIERGNVETCKIGSDKKLKNPWKVEDSPRTKRVKRFVVDGNDELHSLPENLMESFPELSELEISNTPLKEIQPEKLKNLNKLKSLKLPKNSIKYLDSNTFDGVPNLQTLKVNDNNLRHIDENVFKNLPRLNNLDLSNNKLPKITKETLKHLPELRAINLSNNDLNHVDFDLFKKNPKLNSIDLSGNAIKSIDPDSFERLPALFNLDLSKNECIDRKFATSSINPNNVNAIISEHCQPHKSLNLQLKSCQKLVENCKQEAQAKPVELRIKNDAEKEMLKNTLRKSETEVRQLNLQLKMLQSELMKEKELRRSENEKLNYFEIEVRRLRKSCTRIDASHNFLVDIDCDFIEGFDDYSCDAKNLLVGAENSTMENVTGNHKRGKRNADVTALTIRNQNTKFLPNEIYKFFPNIRDLSVDNSKLSKLSRYPFKSLPQLVHLTINKNRIRQIDPTAFNDLPQLESIDLSQNYIEELPQKLFEELPNLKELNLADNMLTTLPQDIIPKVNNLEKFFANNNQFDFIDPRALKKLRKAEVIDLTNGKCIDEKYVKNERGDIVRLIGEISLHCINDDEISDEGFCKGRKLL
jgi:Leucine-rich repeat (LRR) protein